MNADEIEVLMWKWISVANALDEDDLEQETNVKNIIVNICSLYKLVEKYETTRNAREQGDK